MLNLFLRRANFHNDNHESLHRSRVLIQTTKKPQDLRPEALKIPLIKAMNSGRGFTGGIKISLKPIRKTESLLTHRNQIYTIHFKTVKQKEFPFMSSNSTQAVVTDPANPDHFVIRDFPAPTPFPNQAIIRVKAISLNRGEVRNSLTAPPENAPAGISPESSNNPPPTAPAPNPARASLD
jgi:hypothetical protein